MQNLVEFVTEKGGGVLFIAGELFNPLAYRGTPLELLLPIELADARNPTAVGTSVNSFRPELTLEGRVSPIFRFGDNEASSMKIWQKLPELFWYFEAPRKKPAALVLAEHPTVDRVRRQTAAGRLPVRRRGQVDVPRVRRYMAVAVSGRRQVLRPLLGPDDPVHGPIETGRPAAGRGSDRPQTLSAGTADPVPRPLPEPGLAPTSGDIAVQVEKNGQGPRKLTLKLVPGTRNVFEGRCRKPPRASTRSGFCLRRCSTADPDRQLPRRCPGQRV